MARLTTIDMIGHIDDELQSGTGTRTSMIGGEYVDGIWQDGVAASTVHKVNIQPLNQAEINFLTLGGERIQDTRKIYVNDGINATISENDTWTLIDVGGNDINGTFRVISLDNRPWRNYCKFFAVRLDL